MRIENINNSPLGFADTTFSMKPIICSLIPFAVNDIKIMSFSSNILPWSTEKMKINFI